MPTTPTDTGPAGSPAGPPFSAGRGALALAGGAEFGGAMARLDRRLVALAGGPQAAVRVIPAAAAPDGNHRRAGERAVGWFRRLGCRDVAWLPLVDRASAGAPGVVEALAQAALIYLLGGFPGHLAQALAGSRCWAAAEAAWGRGAAIAGSSAGAMVLCGRFYDPAAGRVRRGLGLLKGVILLPHHASFGRRWARRLAEAAGLERLVGIDEETGIVQPAAGAPWEVHGAGSVTLYRQGVPPQRFRQGGRLALD